MNTGRSKIFSNTIYYIGMPVIRNGLAFLTLPILTSFLTPADYGIVGLITIISGFGSVFFGGVNAACARYYFKYVDVEDGLGNFFSTNLLFITGASVIYFTAIYLAFPYVNEFFFKNSVRFIWVGLGFLQFALNYINTINQTIFQNRHEGRIWFINEAVTTFIYVTLAIALVFIGVRFESLIIAGLASEIGRTVITFILLRKLYNLNFRMPLLKESLSYSWPQVPSQVIGFGYSYVDRIIVTRVGDMFQVGILDMTGRVSSILKMIIDGISGVLSPVTLELLKSGTEEAYKKLADLSLKVLAVVLILALGAILFSKEIVVLLMKEGFRGVIYIVPVYIYAYVFGALGMISYWLIYYHAGKTWLQVPIMLIGLISGTGANIILIPLFGLIGAAAAMFISSALLQITQFYIGWRCTPIPFNIRKIVLIYFFIIAETGLLYFLYSLDLHWLIEIPIKLLMLLTFVTALLTVKVIALKDISDTWLYVSNKARNFVYIAGGS